MLLIAACTPLAPREYGGSTYNSSRSADKMPKGPGCYAKALASDQYGDKDVVPYYKYTGNDLINPNIRLVEKSTAPTTKWVKKKADRNCLSSNPEDCLVWCLVEVPGEYYSYHEVLDTNKVKDFKLVTKEQTLIKQGGYTEWKRVVCEPQLTLQLIEDIQNALLEKGYNELSVTGTFDVVTKGSLTQYQKDHGLFFGQVTFETLDLLGVSYEKI